MIAKLTSGNGFSGAARYDLRIGKKEEPTDPEDVKILGLKGNINHTFDENGNYIVDVKQLARDFRFQAMMRPSVRKPVYHWALSWKKGEHVSDEAMLNAANDFMQAIGFNDTQYIVVRHQKDNEHCHVLANIVDSNGERIDTEDLIERAHFAARMITKINGYAWGETGKQETINNNIKPHEKARNSIKPIVQDAIARVNDIEDLPSLLESSGVYCRIKRAENGKVVGISFAYEMDGQLHTFRGSSLDRSLSAGNIVRTIARRKEAERDRAEGLQTVSSSISPVTKRMYEICADIANLEQETRTTGVELSSETRLKFKELGNALKRRNLLQREANEAMEDKVMIVKLGLALSMMNPIAGLMVAVLGLIATDIHQSMIRAEKKKLLKRIGNIRADIKTLENQKARLRIERRDLIEQYLLQKKNEEQFRGDLKTIDEEVSSGIIDALKEEFPFRNPGHMQYIIFDHYNAAIYRAEQGEGAYRRVPTGQYYNSGSEIKADYYENARRALLDRILMCCGDDSPTAFYYRLLSLDGNSDYRVGDIQIQPDGKITFGRERAFGDPEKTTHYVPKIEGQVVQGPVPVVEKRRVPSAPASPTTTPPPPTPQKPQIKVLLSYCNDANQRFRIKERDDGTMVLQALEVDCNSPMDANGRYTGMKWFGKSVFDSYEVLGKDGTYLYLKVEDGLSTKYINQYGKRLTSQQKRSLGVLSGMKGP